MRVLALDVGNRRIGAAVSDPTGLVARPLDVIQRAGDDVDLVNIEGLMDELDVERVIVGYPLHLSGRVGEQARLTEDFAEALSERLDEPVILWDERLSTLSAQRLLIERGENPSAQRDRIDSLAAAILLQDYLDAGLGRDEGQKV